MSKKKILLVEDDPSIHIVLESALIDDGYEVHSCDTVSERDTLLRTHKYDLMLTDIILREGNGLKSLHKFADDYPDLPIIIMSAQNTLDTAVRASELNVYEYFPKPFDLEKLLLTISQAVKPEDFQQNDNIAQYELNQGNMPLVGQSPAMQDVFRMIARLMNNDLSVLILGESGTGKELVAEAIHSLGSRKTGPFIAVNMAAIPAELIESELFGYEKGAFTGAHGLSIGKFEQAQGGTLFLDEIGDMPMQAQTRLLRALQSGTINRLGGKATIKLDVRIIAATNQDLPALIAANIFREDLYYRLNVVPINLPPLRERPEDIARLTHYFLDLASKEGLPRKLISEDALEHLTNSPWRGNVRELKNSIYRLLVTVRDDVINKNAVENILGEVSASPKPVITASFDDAVAQFIAKKEHDRNSDGKIYALALAQFEKPLLSIIMKKVKGNQLRAASMLGINRNTLRKKLADNNIK
ncbi:nitrogen regulation protein NR(I) [Sphingorhabdus lutea]|uniref:DNA-binding transcriptional regulator NtrC n=1 Tax=Sphingorhabdus lutea TaxID=1913578 RepID=A0A1L3JC83_9SPHN|nr:sigma-54 dependent transcriptional regulator [Sphingorhabdus lutea]APG62709.1 nitrogen regulation protein NR(I) [Sphingorhabdus lutea]